MPLINGTFVTQPSVVASVDTSALASLNTNAPNVLAVVGPSVSGIPQQPVLISNPTDVKAKYTDGDLVTGALLAFAPSAQTGGCSQVYMVRVNSATQSVGKIFDIASPVKAMTTVTISGTVAAGQTYTVTSNGVSATYTSTGVDTLSSIASSLAIAINTTAGFQNTFVGFSANASAAVITLTARYAGVDGNSIPVSATSTGGTITVAAATLTGGTGNTLVTLTTTDSGVYTNQVYYKVSPASINGIKFTAGLSSGSQVNGGSVTQDNIYQPLLNIQYTGAGTAATITINDTSLSTNITGATGDAVNLAFSTYTTVGQIVNFLNSTGVYTATVANSNATNTVTAGTFDPLNAVSIKTASVLLTGNLSALVSLINSGNVPYFTGAKTVNPASGVPAQNTNFVYLVGGSDGTTSNADWTNAINSLQQIDCTVVCAISDSQVVHSALSAHCSFMSDQGKRRVFVAGGALGEYNAGNAVPTSTIYARSQALSTQRGVLVSPGVKVADADGNISVKSSAFTAAMVAGMLSAVKAGTPLTHKYLSNVYGLEVNFTPSDKDTLLQNGVLPIEYKQNKGYRIIQSKTTYQGPANLAYNEISVVMAVDSVVEAVQEALDEQLIGTENSPQSLAMAQSITETVLVNQQTAGAIVGDTDSPAFRNISSSTDGTGLITVSFQCSPGVPNNFVALNVATVPYKGSVSTSSAANQ